MRLDHLVFAVGPGGLAGTAARLSALLGEQFDDGGVHPRFGTRNRVLPLLDHMYLELVEVLDHPASDKAPFGQAVRARTENGGGWLGWVVSVDDLEPIERRLGREAVLGNRHRPDGVELRWRQIGVKGLMSDPQLPFMISWDCAPALHPSNAGDSDAGLVGLEIAGDPERVREWLDLDPDFRPDSLEFSFVSPHGTPGLMSVSFRTADGVVTI
jgi:hypothetical protein